MREEVNIFKGLILINTKGWADLDIINLNKIVKSFGGTKIINRFSLDIKRGEILGLIGKSGCGKTTLLKILTGMLNYDLGEIKFNVERIHSFNKDLLKENIGFASQGNMLYNELTLLENLNYYGRLYGLKKEEIEKNSTQLIKLFDLGQSKNKLIRNFSGGMRKRANILVSLIHNPEVLILDEPTVGLDPILRENIWSYVKEINKIGKTVIVTSHLLDELQENCTSIAFMDDGQISAVIDSLAKRNFSKKNLNEIFKEWVKNG